MPIKNKTFLWKRISMAFWQKNTVSVISVFPWLSTVPTVYDDIESGRVGCWRHHWSWRSSTQSPRRR